MCMDPTVHLPFWQWANHGGPGGLVYHGPLSALPPTDPNLTPYVTYFGVYVPPKPPAPPPPPPAQTWWDWLGQTFLEMGANPGFQ